MCNLRSQTFHDLTLFHTPQSVTQLENELDKAIIRHDASFIINQRYHAIIEHMKEESRQYPARLDTMEQSLVQQQRELVELKKMHADALQSRDDGKQRLQQVSTSRRAAVT